MVPKFKFAAGRRLIRHASGLFLGTLTIAAGCAHPAADMRTADEWRGGVTHAAQPILTVRRAPAEPIAQFRHEDPPVVVGTPPALPTLADNQKDSWPIDLPTALHLAGANNLQIALARARLQQAEARLDQARVLWLPSAQLGAAYNLHAGQIQDTRGAVIDVTRNSIFVGGGPLTGGSLNGANNGPSRLSVGLPLADALFNRLVERQQVGSKNAELAATFNDTLLRVGAAYLDLLAAQQQVAIALDAETNAKELVRLVDSRVRNGTALPADGFRAKAEMADRQRQAHRAEENRRVASTELVRLLRLDPTITLIPIERQPAPLELVNLDAPLPALIEQGLVSRPELAQYQALVQATVEQLRQERWRPWIPAVQVSYSAGGFGGGPGTAVANFNGRGDFDALLVWELRNLGVGNRTVQRERASQNVHARLSAESMRDNVAADVVRAYHQALHRRQQIEATREQLKASTEALPLNFKGITDGNLRAIEAQQAIQALATAQNQYLAAVIDYNQAQFQLLRALGCPLDVPGCGTHE